MGDAVESGLGEYKSWDVCLLSCLSDGRKTEEGSGGFSMVVSGVSVNGGGFVDCLRE